MASNEPIYEEEVCRADSDDEEASDTEAGGRESDGACGSDSDRATDEDSDCQPSLGNQRGPCKFYNSPGGCRDGTRCTYRHVCKYALTGSCRYKSRCKLSHDTGGSKRASRGSASHDEEEDEDEDEEAPRLADGRPYQWQLNDGNGWLEIENDHVIEAQYSLPHSRSMKLYTTDLYGVVNIGFNRMRVYGKSLRVRRLDDGNTEWMWYCILSKKWKKYGDKDSKGNPSPAKSSEIEAKFQRNPQSSFTFSVGVETLEINFKDMQQLGKGRKRRVTRRPVYRPKRSGVSQTASGLQNVSLDTKPRWQFEGDREGWHDFKQRGGSSVDSDYIEKKYQENPTGTADFKLNGQTYKLNFQDKTQTNVRSKNRRRIRRVQV